MMWRWSRPPAAAITVCASSSNDNHFADVVAASAQHVHQALDGVDLRIRGGRRNSLQHAALSHAARVNLWPRAVIGPCLFHRRCAISLDTACTFGSCKREHTRLVRWQMRVMRSIQRTDKNEAHPAEMYSRDCRQVTPLSRGDKSSGWPLESDSVQINELCKPIGGGCEWQALQDWR